MISKPLIDPLALILQRPLSEAETALDRGLLRVVLL